MDVLYQPSPMDLDSVSKGKPFLTRDQVCSLVKDNYNFEVKHLKVLDGYDNQNFLVEVLPQNEEKGNMVTAEVTVKYVLKITNSYLSKADQGLRDVTHLMEFLSTRGFACTHPVPNKYGQLCQLLTFQNLALENSENGVLANQKMEDTFMVRLVTFLPGTVLNDLPLVPDNVFEEMGETLAQVHVAFQELDMDKTGLQEMGETSPWSLDCLTKFRKFLYVVEDIEKRRLAEDVMNEFERVVQPRKKELPHGFLHGDFNDVNMIIDVQDGSKESHLIGFIDFDDASYSCVVHDIGVSLMYVLQCKTSSRDSAARHFLQGYSKYRKMPFVEKDCLLYCIAGRFVQSLLGGLYNYSVRKDKYVLGTQQRGWDALKEIWTRGKEVSYQKWKFS